MAVLKIESRIRARAGEAQRVTTRWRRFKQRKITSSEIAEPQPLDSGTPASC